MSSVVKYPFPDDPAATDYCVFPPALEDDELVLFHATPAKNLESILKDGFSIPDPASVVGLRSVSFAKRSATSLTHAMGMRDRAPGAYSILAVRYKTLKRDGLVINLIDIHDYTLDPAPEIIGYCEVPTSYVHA
jgi:hypothetical protein